MIGRSEFVQIKEQSQAILIQLDLASTQLPSSVQLGAEILSELSIQEENAFFSMAYFSKTVEQGNTELLQARLDKERRQKEALELKETWKEQTRSLLATLEKELREDSSEIATIDWLQQEYAANQNRVQALKKSLRGLFDATTRIIADTVSIEELIRYTGEELQNPFSSPRKQFSKRFIALLEEPVEQFGKLGDFVSPVYQVSSNWLSSKIAISAVLSEKTKGILEAISLHPKRVEETRANHKKNGIELRKIVGEQQDDLDAFVNEVARCEREFKVGKEKLIAELEKEKVFAKEFAEKIKEAAKKNKLIQDKQDIVEKNNREIGILLIAAQGERDLQWLQEKQKGMRSLLSETQQEIELIAQHFAEFNTLLAEPASRCKSNKKNYQGAVWGELFESVRQVSLECKLLKQNQEQLSREVEKFKQDQTFAQCIDKKIAAMNAAALLPQVATLSEEQVGELEKGLTDEQHIENYKKACEKYAEHLEKEIKKELMPYVKSLQMALQPVQNEAENTLRTQGSYSVLCECLEVSEVGAFLLEDSLLLAVLKKLYAREDAQAEQLIMRINEVLAKDEQVYLQIALEKYRLIIQLTASLGTTQDAAQKKSIFLTKLKENASQEILGKKRDHAYEVFAKRCGLLVAVILGFTLVLAYGAWKVYQRFYGDERTHGLRFFKQVEKETLEPPLPENNNRQRLSLSRK